MLCWLHVILAMLYILENLMVIGFLEKFLTRDEQTEDDVV